MSVLDEILKQKKRELVLRKRKVSFKDLMDGRETFPQKRPFASAVAAAAASGNALIAEIKKKSPSAGILRHRYNAEALARQLQEGGACALSVLTDRRYFGGALEDIFKVREASRLPVLQKDFLIDEYQVAESAKCGADAVLLISDALKQEELEGLLGLAMHLGLDVLLESHTRINLEKALELKPDPARVLIGINNRDLSTLGMDRSAAEKSVQSVPGAYTVVSESGIRSAGDIRRMKEAGLRAFLVGEALMKAEDPCGTLKRLLGKIHDEG